MTSEDRGKVKVVYEVIRPTVQDVMNGLRQVGKMWEVRCAHVVYQTNSLHEAVQIFTLNAIRAAVEQEREECAKIAEAAAAYCGSVGDWYGKSEAEGVVRKIRARSATSPSNNPE